MREATVDDVPTLLANTLAVARETEGIELDPAVVERGIRTGMTEGHGRWFIAGDGVGSCMVTREWSDWRCGWYWWLQSVYVAPEARRTGVWRALWGAVQAAAEAEGALAVRLLVRHDNARAIAVYGRSGLRPMEYVAMEQ